MVDNSFFSSFSSSFFSVRTGICTLYDFREEVFQLAVVHMYQIIGERAKRVRHYQG